MAKRATIATMVRTVSVSMFFFFQAEDGIRDVAVTGVQTCALPIFERVDASIRSIREGQFLNALVREESREDETWVIRLRNLPDAPETYYLMELMASHDFQTALHNYLDLEDLRSRLNAWKTSLDAFDDIIRLRGQNYEPLLPEVDAQFRELDSRIHIRLEQRKHLAERLQAMLTAPRPDYLATAEEQTAGERKIGRASCRERV